MAVTPENRAERAEYVVHTYGTMLFRLCLVILKNEYDAEDVIQDTAVRYIEKAPVFADQEHEKAWLIRVATNRCRDIQRLRMRRERTEELDLTRYVSDPEDCGVLEALTTLPEKFRVVLLLYYVEEYSMEEIAQMIDRSVSAVKMRLQKGRKLLEEQYRKEYL